MAAPVVRVYPELMKSGSNDCPVHDRSKNRRAFHRVVHRATASTLRNSWVDSWDMSGKCDTICWIYSVISSLGSSVNDTWRTGSLPVISCLSSFFSLFFDSAACQALSSLPSRGLLLIEIWSSYIRMTVHVSVYCMCAWACVSTEQKFLNRKVLTRAHKLNIVSQSVRVKDRRTKLLLLMRVW